MESSLNKRIDGLQNDLNQKIDNLQYSITRLSNQQQVQEKGRFPSQTQPNLRGVHELSYSSEPTPKMDEVKAVITLRSGKEIEHPVSKPVEKANQEKEMESDD